MCPGLKSHLEEAALSAATCLQLLQHSLVLLLDAIKATPPSRPSALKISGSDGSAPPNVASAAYALLAAHSEALPPAVSQPMTQPTLQPAQPDSAKAMSSEPKPAHEYQVPVPEVLWQIFEYAEHAGLELSTSGMRVVWTSQAMPGDNCVTA